MNIDIGWLVGIVGALVAALALKSRSTMKDKAKDAERRVEAVNESKGVANEVAKKSDSDLLDLASRWLRNRKG